MVSSNDTTCERSIISTTRMSWLVAILSQMNRSIEARVERRVGSSPSTPTKKERKMHSVLHIVKWAVIVGVVVAALWLGHGLWEQLTHMM